MLKNKYGRYLQGYELMPLLGFKRGSHLPEAGFDPVEVDGVKFMCKPAAPKKVRVDGRRVKVSTHRLMYLCEECEPKAWVPFGRACQHKHKVAPVVHERSEPCLELAHERVQYPID